MLTLDQVRQYHQRGFLLLPAFLDEGLLKSAQANLSLDHPSAQAYFKDPDQYPLYSQTQFSLKRFPFSSIEVNRLLVSDCILGAAKQLLGSDDIRLNKGELWAKYAGAIDYDQAFHRDFGNHTLLVPRQDQRYKELSIFIYLSDVDEQSGPTAVLPRPLTDPIAFAEMQLPETLSFEPQQEEFLAVGPAGSVLFYSYDVFHRATQMTGCGKARMTVLGDYRCADAVWISRQGWPEAGHQRAMVEFLSSATPHQRALFDIPLPGHHYWNEQTLRDMASRYQGMDMEPYRVSAESYKASS
jgi:hypothetical protein